jgi:hypothetical protein
MYIILIPFIIIIIILWIITNKIRKNNVNDSNNINMENIFFSEVEKGEKKYKLMDIFNQFDLMFVKSLFQSEQIPYYIDNEYGSKIYPGLQMGVYILEKDYNDAINIIEEFDKIKLKDIKINKQ